MKKGKMTESKIKYYESIDAYCYTLEAVIDAKRKVCEEEKRKVEEIRKVKEDDFKEAFVIDEAFKIEEIKRPVVPTDYRSKKCINSMACGEELEYR